MSATELWTRVTPKLIAILRGIQPPEVEAHIAALLAAGFRIMEVPLNSPQPFESIAVARRMAEERGGDILIGAGTVVTLEGARDALHAGAEILVAPNMNPAIIEYAVAKGAAMLSGVVTPSEAFAALECGASGLKIFPAHVVAPEGIAALRAVLPPQTHLCAVGGVGEADFPAYWRAGARGFGLGGSLYKPGDAAAQVGERARRAVEAFNALASPPSTL